MTEGGPGEPGDKGGKPPRTYSPAFLAQQFKPGNQVGKGHHFGRPKSLMRQIDEAFGPDTNLMAELVKIAKGQAAWAGRRERWEAYKLIAAYRHGKPLEQHAILAAEIDGVTAIQALQIEPTALVALARQARQKELAAHTQASDVIDVSPVVSPMPVLADSGSTEGAPAKQAETQADTDADGS